MNEWEPVSAGEATIRHGEPPKPERDWRRQYYQVGERVVFVPTHAQFWRECRVPATVEAIECNHYGRISYRIRFDRPVERGHLYRCKVTRETGTVACVEDLE